MVYSISIVSSKYGAIAFNAIDSTYSDTNKAYAIGVLLGRAMVLLDSYNKLECMIYEDGIAVYGKMLTKHNANDYSDILSNSVSNTKPPSTCKECGGTGKVTLFTSVRDCNCGAGKPA